MQIFIHGSIYTGSETEWADALVIDGAGMILAVGSQEDLQRRFPNAITEDLNGQYLFPGFIDAHSHPAIFCREIRDPNFGNVRSWDIARSHIQEYIQAHPNRPWYVIFGWDEKKWGDLTQEALDTVTTDSPLFIIHESNQKGSSIQLASKRFIKQKNACGMRTASSMNKIFVAYKNTPFHHTTKFSHCCRGIYDKCV